MMEDNGRTRENGKDGGQSNRVPISQCEMHLSEDKIDTSSSSSVLSYSNFTMSCGGADTLEENEPSTSGCSSLLAHTEKKRSKAEKKERVKEYLKELKSMVKPDGRGSTLSTLQHVLTSMRKIKGIEKGKTEKTRVEHMDTCQSSIHIGMGQSTYDSLPYDGLSSESLQLNEEVQIILSPMDNTVRATSDNLKIVLGCHRDRWIGRMFDDFIYKPDIVTYKSVTRIENEANLDLDGDTVLGKAKTIYLRLREFKNLSNTGFSLRKQEIFKPFQCTFVRKRMCKREMQMEATYESQYEDSFSSGISVEHSRWDSSSDHARLSSSQEEEKLYTVFYCIPLISPYKDCTSPPEMRTFEMRQTLFCSFCHVEPTMIPLLGYLPQEMIGVSIFNFFHNDDLQRLFTIFQKVIALKGVPYKSGQIRFLAKNGCWLSCITEWSSFVNPWSKRLEFIIGKHSIVKGPDNTDIFCENFSCPTIEETPQSVLLARQKIKNLLLQPVETVYLGDSEKSKSKHSQHSVVIIDEKDLASSSDAEVTMVAKQDALFKKDHDQSGLHGKGILFKENAISRAYEQLSYTSCIKKFLLSQPHSYTSESDVRKSSSEDGFDEDSKTLGMPCNRWLTGSFDDLVAAKRVYAQKTAETRSLPALDDMFWKKRIVSSDSDFDIRVPKPPSFGSSTKVLVSEQEQRDLENLLDPVNVREQLHPPLTTDMPAPREPVLAGTPVMNLTRKSLLKHTLLQEQLYLASASPERNILFLNETRDIDSPASSGRQRHSLKRIHSPDLTRERCKSGRRNEDSISTPMTGSVLNPIFPLLSFDTREKNSYSSILSMPKMTPVVVPMQMYPIVTLQSSDKVNINQLTSSQAEVGTSCSGMTFRQGEMMGFQPSVGVRTCTANLGLPIPVHQLNSYLMQQGSILTSRATPQPTRKQEREKTKVRAKQSSSESSSMEDSGSSLYMLESSSNSIKLKYSQMVLQSFAQQMMPQKGLDPPSWLGKVNFTENVQYRYQLYRSKPKRLMKKFREDLEKLKQSDMILHQLDEIMEEDTGPLLDQENEFLIFEPENDLHLCSCMEDSCCHGWLQQDHGITEAMKSFRKHSKKKEKRKKPMIDVLQDAAVKTEDNYKMEVDSIQEVDPEESESIHPDSIPKEESCCSSNKSQEDESDSRCDISSDSINSLNTSDITPSDQRSNNENGSSLKESDGDAMSKKSDSSSSEKQLASSESDSESKSSVEIFDKMFTSLHMCFPNSHQNMVPWLAGCNFDDDIKMKYQLVTGDQENILERDRQQLALLDEGELVNEQLSALMADCQDSNIDISSMMLSNEMQDKDVAIGE